MERPTFRQFTRYTLEATGLLIVIGVYTAATGAGLACSQQWPLCDGGVLPQTLPSFIEWFHRFDAMLTGFLILGTALWSWRASVPRRAKLAATTAVVLLPLQISIGAITVTLNGALPRGYSVPVHAAHLLAALTIFSALLLTALSAHRGHYERSARERVRLALLAALILLPVNALAGRATPLVEYTPGAQALFIASGLAVFAALVAAVDWLPEATGRGDHTARLRWTLLGATGSVLGILLLGRDLVLYTDAVHLVNWLLYAVALVLAGLPAWFFLAGDDGSTPEFDPDESSAGLGTDSD